ncbi:hypothetical protein [Phosphitispora fastidiosa]|uniref:hypothetical protein n=1 Tax=Phosphitispora fastidiosa TaxID=2837202 RepID=UPI001E3984C4|nr:hypothetical protein [Phosphitispora fastidiosa]MBU7005248.1 hypothetical protein [Phosphitispora fastidiosa]
MQLQYKTAPQDEVSDSIGLLISILVRYPELGTINYDPELQQLRFTFIFSGVLDEEKMVNFKDMVVASIEAYNSLENRSPLVTEVRFNPCEEFTMLEIIRDVGTMSQEELSMLIELVHSNFKKDLIFEKNEYLLEEDLLIQEELIEHMLENIKLSFPQKNLIAFREDGRVLVFNK